MSEVQRYTYEVDDGVFAECVLGEDYDAVQSELAALREELAEYQKILTSYKNNYVTNLAYNAVQSSLTTAEQRNAELTQALERGKLWLELFRAWSHDMGGNYEEGHADGWNACLDKVKELNK